MLSNLEGVWKIDASKEHRAASGRDSKSKLHHDAIGREGDRQEVRGEEQRPSGCERLESEAVRKGEGKIRRRRDAGAEHWTSSGRRGRRDRRRDGVRMRCDGMATSGRNVTRTLRLESRLTVVARPVDRNVVSVSTSEGDMSIFSGEDGNEVVGGKIVLRMLGDRKSRELDSGNRSVDSSASRPLVVPMGLRAYGRGMGVLRDSGGYSLQMAQVIGEGPRGGGRTVSEFPAGSVRRNTTPID
ncbi:hypothetical protein B9Z19DRAFT_1120716 [Tuber borchii]|uniref:Uncharacterized protein n=1 Tax=Tuber borchii TaxID=42251 RepID=A0A2T7A463_TUBBO|nr:hypothetical protein B9Z19DRAFT_1120716 [Tuber borchii]